MLLKQQVMKLSDLEIRMEPFHYFVTPKAFDEAVSLSVLNWLETTNCWKLVEKDFYEQYEFDLADAHVPKNLAFLYEKDFLDYLISRFEDIFSAEFDDKVDVTAHKLILGQTIRLHNDYIPGQETHRLVVQLNREWREDYGGFFLLFNSTQAEDIHRIICPTHNSAAGFEISPKSNHAVSKTYGGERFTLVYSLYAKGSHY